MIEQAKNSILPIGYLNSRMIACYSELYPEKSMMVMVYDAHFTNNKISFNKLIVFTYKEKSITRRQAYLINSIQFRAYEAIVHPVRGEISKRYENLENLETTLRGQEIEESTQFRYLTDEEMKQMYPILFSDDAS